MRVEIKEMEDRLKVILAEMFRQGQFDEVKRVVQETFDRLPLDSGHFQLLMKSQATGFGESRDIPASVDVLGALSTAVATDAEGSRRVSVVYGPINLTSPKPCEHCKGSGVVLSHGLHEEPREA
ncbi:MAG: hypothetical protein Q8T11_05970 [Elusimicrobiota bacterium]|nr:hypothetical protein [Elusimicrobiota bacterium]